LIHARILAEAVHLGPSTIRPLAGAPGFALVRAHVRPGNIVIQLPMPAHPALLGRSTTEPPAGAIELHSHRISLRHAHVLPSSILTRLPIPARRVLREQCTIRPPACAIPLNSSHLSLRPARARQSNISIRSPMPVRRALQEQFTTRPPACVIRVHRRSRYPNVRARK
jgi:hypothetical protein